MYATSCNRSREKRQGLPAKRRPLAACAQSDVDCAVIRGELIYADAHITSSSQSMTRAGRAVWRRMPLRRYRSRA